jgi:tetratricopeptide (TPR) repeat protein
LDCERFDRDSLELLYDELDDVSASALRRHIAQCPRCQPVWQKLVLVRKRSSIPLETPEPSVLEDVLSRQKFARRTAPLGERVGHLVSVVAEYAMRPQLAMAALLVLMVGSSLVLVRSRPGRGDQVAVREVGSPEQDAAEPRSALETAENASDPSATAAFDAATPTSAPPAPETAALAAGKANLMAESAEAPLLPPTYQEAMAAYQDGRYAEAERLFGEVSKAGGEKSGSAALHEAHAARNGSGCQRAASYYDEVAHRFAGSSVSNEAAWHAALCYRALGQFERARAHLERLRAQPAYVARVEKLLGTAEAERIAARAARSTENAETKASAASPGAPAAAAGAAKAAPPRAEPTAADTAPSSSPAERKPAATPPSQ